MSRRASAVLAAALVAGLAASSAGAQPPAAQNPNGQPPVMAPLDVTADLLPIPKVGEGAPLYTASELTAIETVARRAASQANSDSRRCSSNPGARLFAYGQARYTLSAVNTQAYTANLALMTAADRAAKATEAAVAARRDGARGLVTTQQVEAAELKRQAAVNLFVKRREEANYADATVQARMTLELRGTPTDIVPGELAQLGAERDYAESPEATARARSERTLALVDITAREAKGGDLVVISGKIRNTGTRMAISPAIEITAVDRDGRSLRSKVAQDSVRRYIAPGSDLAFAYAFDPKPRNAARVTVDFAKDYVAPPMTAIGMFCGNG